MRIIGQSSIGRHQSTLLTTTIPVVSEPASFQFPASEVKNDNSLDVVIKTVREYAVRAGDEGIRALQQLLQLRMLGGSTGSQEYQLCDTIMLSTANLNTPVQASMSSPTPMSVKYSNHERSPSRKQTRRIRNSGDLSAFSTGLRNKRQAELKSTLTNLTLSGM